jgi:hypothetical protein
VEERHIFQHLCCSIFAGKNYKFFFTITHQKAYDQKLS